MGDLKVCKTCCQALALGAFEAYKVRDGTEKTRADCKRCQAAKRKARARETPKRNPANVTPPAACQKCGRGPDMVRFKFRTDTLLGTPLGRIQRRRRP